ncbi:MAG: hypothetical protein PVJ57_19095 [Phycisphaerae bacterium]
MNAVRLLLSYTLGRPTEADVFERIEALEALADELSEGSRICRGEVGLDSNG